MLDAAYVVPVRSELPPDHEFTSYLRAISQQCQLVIVDGSRPDVFEAATRVWSAFAQHVRPDPELECRNGKVHGVLTGMRRARHERVVIADDDVRYDPVALRRVLSHLDEADLVRPQNYFDPLPWYARWDTARTLINRAFGCDFPGTLAVRRTLLERIGGYDGDVLFENLELIRSVEAAGGRVSSPRGLFVARRPPTLAHFRAQRVRQAYEELARPVGFCTSLAVVPSLVIARGRRGRVLAALAAISIVVAECGRHRASGRTVFPLTSSLMAPLWVAERSACSWLALVTRLRGGCPYGTSRLVRAANTKRALRRRLASR